MMFLDPHGPARSYKYPATSDILAVSVDQIDPKTITGHTYKLTKLENRLAMEQKLSMI